MVGPNLVLTAAHVIEERDIHGNYFKANYSTITVFIGWDGKVAHYGVGRVKQVFESDFYRTWIVDSRNIGSPVVGGFEHIFVGGARATAGPRLDKRPTSALLAGEVRNDAPRSERGSDPAGKLAAR